MEFLICKVLFLHIELYLVLLKLVDCGDVNFYYLGNFTLSHKLRNPIQSNS